MVGEAVQVVRLLWSGERVSFDGNHYQLDNALCDPAPVQQPAPPILIGGHGERHLLRVAAAHADITNMSADMASRSTRQSGGCWTLIAPRWDGEPSEVVLSHNTHVFIGRDEAAVEELLAEHAARHGVSVERFRASMGNAIVGTPAQCVEQLRRYTDYGIGWFFLLFPEPVSVGDLELFASEVMPHFAILNRQ